ncbi:hypothetical protein HDU89_000727 [Geranomyces variabilis]|nr:hypothetical protein HDU89_000727 [Geranomyces variabilis]
MTHKATCIVTGDPLLAAVDASLGGENVRIAGRMIVTTTLKRSLAVDVPIANFDVSLAANLLAMCVGRIVYLWALDTLSVLHKFGRNVGNANKVETVRDCSFNANGTLLVAGGDDMRIVVWNVKNFKSEKVIDAHKGVIYQVEFTADSKRVISGSDDGRVSVWDWKTGGLIHSFMRHPSAVRCFDFSHANPDRIICGRGDGNTTTWDTGYSALLDNIEPDAEWSQNALEHSLMGWADPHKHHTGAILALQISPNNRLLATGATDHTCKLWSITSYAKDYESVQQEIRDADRQSHKMNDGIRLEDPDDGIEHQMKTGDVSAWKIGDAPISQGYHGDLVYTFRHEGPVLSVRFNNTASMVITGCMDATCRLWSTRRGDMLFQINVPAPVSSIFVDEKDEMYCVCQNRLLFFSIKANAREEDLPSYWQRRSLERLTEEAITAEDMRRQGVTPPGQSSEQPMSPEEAELVKQISEEMKDGGLQKKITIPELRNLISHGLVAPTFLQTLLDQFETVDSAALVDNMKKKELSPTQILRLLVNTPFHPRDIFTALASKQSDALFDMVKRGAPITDMMVQLGFKPMSARDEQGQATPSDHIFLNFRDFWPRRRGFHPNDARYPGARGGVFPYPRAARDIYAAGYDDYDYDDDDESYLLEEELRAGRAGTRGQTRGKILHFIPSEHLKLLKDFHANRDLKPIFLRDLVLDLNPLSGYPNFTTDADPRDNRPMIANRAVPRQGVRFNDMDTYGRMTKSKITGRRGEYEQPFNIRDLPVNLGASQLGSSSTTMFQPSKYVRARGLNISFQPPRAGAAKAGERLRGHVYAEPIVIRHNRGQEVRQQFVVGRSVGMRERTIDDDE